MNKVSRINDEIEFNKNDEENILNIKIPLSLENQQIIDWFFKEFKEFEIKHICDDWILDEKNSAVISPNKTYFLTKRELTFFKLLIKNKIVTYEQMNWYIWNGEFASENAVKGFVKNFKKKIPPSILKNLKGIGYRLIDDINV